MALPSSTNIGTQAVNSSVRELPGATDYAGQDSSLKPEIWSELVRRDTKEKNIFKDFVGGEGANQPVVTKRDLAAGGKAKVTFTSTTPIRGQGVIGENQLKGNEDNLRFGTHSVEVDLIRHAVAYTQVLQLLRFTGKTLDQLSAELMSDWAARKMQDDIQIAFRNEALAQTNDHATGWKAATDNFSWNTGILTTDMIEESKLRLIGAGAQPMSIDSDYSGADVPQYLSFAPANIMNSLRADASYAPALQYAASRSTTDHPYFKGTLPAWENNVIYSHNIIFDTAEGRQGSPLLPVAFLGKNIVAAGNVNTGKIEGGGHYGNNDLDYFANFLGFDWKFTTAGQSYTNNFTASTDAREYHLTIYDTKTHKYNVVKYKSADVAAAGNELARSGGTLTNVKSSAMGGANIDKVDAGSIIYQSYADGKPMGFKLHMGGNAMYYAEGSISSEPIYHYDDFATSSGRAHLTATGVQSVRGLAPFKDTLGRMPNYNLVAARAKIVGVNL
jgi:N4-gp56 family major capsid protein